MQQHDYVYAFGDLTDSLSQVNITNGFTGNRQSVFVAVDDAQFLERRFHNVPSNLADCIDLAVAVAVADRLSVRKGDWTCRIHICLPLRHPEFWNTPQVLKQLQDILYMYTQDHWSFEFRMRSSYGRFSERAACLPFFSQEDSPIEVALWSGGLDSLAGLYHTLSSTTAIKYVLFGTGMNTLLHNRQDMCAQLMETQFPSRTSLVQVPYRLENTKEMQKHALQRSRGFVFLLLGAVCAFLEHQNVLFVYENGVGAINLHYSDAEVGLDHSLSVHPLSLLRMGTFVSSLFSTSFTFQNPYLFKTKAQMCRPLVDSSVFHQLVVSTFTCDRPHREYPLQCGYCSSCLLRRQALAVVSIIDPTSYISTEASFKEQELRSSYGDYLRAMLTQVVSLREDIDATDPWKHLSKRYLPLLEMVDEMNGWNGMSKAQLIEQVLHLYERYVQEWERVYQRVGFELLEGNNPMSLQRNRTSKGD